jgi:hypothetical protein
VEVAAERDAVLPEEDERTCGHEETEPDQGERRNRPFREAPHIAGIGTNAANL